MVDAPPPPFAVSPPPSPPRAPAPRPLSTSSRLPSDPNLAARVAAVPVSAVAAVKARLAASQDAAVRAFLASASPADVDDMANQFLRAAAHCEDTATERLTDTLKWRAAPDSPAARACAACGADPRSHHMFVAGELGGCACWRLCVLCVG